MFNFKQKVLAPRKNIILTLLSALICSSFVLAQDSSSLDLSTYNGFFEKINIQKLKNPNISICFPDFAISKIIEIENNDSLTTYLKQQDFNGKKSIINDECLFQFYFNFGDYLLYDKYKILEAQTNLRTAIELASSLQDSKSLFKSYLLYGHSYYRMNDCISALKFYEMSLKVALRIQDERGIIVAKLNIANCQSESGKYIKAIDSYYNALEYFETQKDTTNIATTYLNIGTCFLEVKEFEEAIKIYMKADSIIEKYSEKSTIMISTGIGIYESLASLFFGQNDFDRAEYYLTKSKKVGIDFNQEHELCKTYYLLSIIYDNQGKKALAEEFLQIALANCENYNSSHLDYVYLLYAEKQLKEGNIEEAINYCNNIEEISLNGNLMSTYYCEQCYYEVYEQIGDFKNAFKHYKLFVALRDSIQNDENIVTLKVAQVKYASEKEQLEKKVQIQELSLANQRKDEVILVRNFILLFVSALSGFIFYLLYYRNKKSKEIHKVIASKNKELKIANEQTKERNILLTEKQKELQAELKSKLLLISTRNEMLKNLEKKTSDLEIPYKDKMHIKKLILNQQNKKIIDGLEEQFLGVHDDFVKNLTGKHPNLNVNHIKLCILIKSGLSNKEVAQLRYVSYESIKMAKNRLNKKLDFKSEGISLYNYLMLFDSPNNIVDSN